MAPAQQPGRISVQASPVCPAAGWNNFNRKPNTTLCCEQLPCGKFLWCAQLADMVAARAQQGKNYGVVLVPEGLIECVPEVRNCISDFQQQAPVHTLAYCSEGLQPQAVGTG